LIELAIKTANHARAGDWGDLVRPPNLFSDSAARRVETPVGERVSLWLGDADDGQPSAHAMIAGQTGSGKSYLLHVFITGLASRYSPDELRFVLIDGKQGVEFEAYRNLPHADVVCLRTSPEMARSVLEDFAAEMEDRYERFQRANVVKLEDYRKATGERMPRMLLVVDEYQQLLEGDPERGARLLGRVLEKGRAAGTHLVLGSQTFNVQGLPSTSLSHVHLRASLSLAQDYLQGIQVFGAEGKRLIRELAPSGEVVINHESGRDGANKRSAVARLPKGDDSNALADAVAEIVAHAKPKNGEAPRRPIVLSGRDGAILTENPFAVYWREAPPSAETLQKIARQPVRKGGFGIETWSFADRPLPLWFGRKFDVRGHALAVLRRAPGNNLLMLGSHALVRLGALANGLAALACMVPSSSLDIDIIDGMSTGLPGEKLLQAGCSPLQKKGARVRIQAPSEAPKVLAEAVEDLNRRGQLTGSTETGQRLIILSEPEYLSTLHVGQQGFGLPPKGAPADLRDLIQRGPQAGIHVLVTASGLSAVGTILNPTRELRGFTHRVVQQMNEDDSMTLFASLIGARIAEQADHPSALLQVDLMQGVRAGTLFKGYGASSDIFASQDANALSARLAELFT
jgi:S-DNA-T family DNA segregation ATPase FtsK/SpoIIIE